MRGDDNHDDDVDVDSDDDVHDEQEGVMMVLGMVVLWRCRGCRPSTATAMLVCRNSPTILPGASDPSWLAFSYAYFQEVSSERLRYISLLIFPATFYQDHSNTVSYSAGDWA